MSVAKTQEDPRDATLEVKFTLPNTWYRDNDVLGSSTMFFAGLILVTRNRFLAWPAVIFAINGLINHHPLRSKDGQGGGWNNILYVFKLPNQVSLTNVLKASALWLFLHLTFHSYSCLNLLINTL
ncbi:hypothetical protein AX14_005952 [Amanita brunnescens Koide BX004]|nr:hypothetical protein AX14_005952 [Amanita brunnescens Koide BX004]